MRPALLAVAALAALLAYCAGRRAAEPIVHYERVEVPVEVLVQSEPDTVVRWRDRIVYRTVQAEQRATAPGGAVPDVAAFCAAAGWVAPGATIPPEVGLDTEPAPADSPALPVALARSGRWDGRALELWTVSSAGGLGRETFRVRGRHEWTMSGDSAVVRASRWWMVRALLPVATCAAGGALAHELGSAVPLVAGCGVGAWMGVR